jgi:putative oxidoreductase
MDLGLLALRVVVGLLFVGHGTQKLMGWFGGGGIEGTGAHFETLGYRPGRAWAALGGLAEACGGTALALGFLTPLGSLAIIAMMTNAIASVHAPNGPWVQNGGYEYPLVLIAVAAALAYVGPGAWSIDAVIGWNPSGYAVGGVAVAGGVTVGLMGFTSRRTVQQQPARREQRRAA